MKTFITKSILTSVLLIFIGLSVSAAARDILDYSFDSDLQVSSGHPTISSGKSIGEIQKGFGLEFEDPFNPGGTDPDGGYNDGTLGGFGDDDDDPFDPGGDTDPDCAYNDCPVGSGIYILLLLVAAYGGYIFRRKKLITA